MYTDIHTHTFIPKGSWFLEPIVRLFGLWEEDQSTWRESQHAQGGHVNSMQRDPRPGFKPFGFKPGNNATNCPHCRALMQILWVKISIYMRRRELKIHKVVL